MNKTNNEKLTGNAKSLRKNMTKEEARLWYQFLCRYPDRFRRQYVIGNYIADFYCHKAKLIIEIDGSQHFSEEGLLRDNFRTEILEGYDLKIIRFTNHQINTNFLGVCEYIDTIVKSLLKDN